MKRKLTGKFNSNKNKEEKNLYHKNIINGDTSLVNLIKNKDNTLSRIRNEDYKIKMNNNKNNYKIDNNSIYINNNFG